MSPASKLAGCIVVLVLIPATLLIAAALEDEEGPEPPAASPTAKPPLEKPPNGVRIGVAPDSAKIRNARHHDPQPQRKSHQRVPATPQMPPVEKLPTLSAEQLLAALEEHAVEYSLYSSKAKAARSLKQITQQMDVAIKQRRAQKKAATLGRLWNALDTAALNPTNAPHRKERQEIISSDGILKSIRTLPPLPVARARYERTPEFDPIRKWLTQRPDLAGLPLKESDEVRLDFEAAEAMRKNSTAFVRFRSFPHTGDRLIVQHLDEQKWSAADIPALTQILQAAAEPVRLEYASTLDAIRSPAATEALVKRALFDVSPRVRAEAIRALKTRPITTIQPRLLQGLRYPWQPVANHAAEALVKLDDRTAVPKLRKMLTEPDPKAPFKDDNGKWQVRELARVNHLKNCYLCHAPSLDRKDLVRGTVPDPYQPLPREYYETSAGYFVRADVTYLKQDFSTVHRVENAKPLPEKQRFDYFIRTRELAEKEAQQLLAGRDGAGYRKAVRYALHRLTRN